LKDKTTQILNTTSIDDFHSEHYNTGNILNDSSDECTSTEEDNKNSALKECDNIKESGSERSNNN